METLDDGYDEMKEVYRHATAFTNGCSEDWVGHWDPIRHGDCEDFAFSLWNILKERDPSGVYLFQLGVNPYAGDVGGDSVLSVVKVPTLVPSRSSISFFIVGEKGSGMSHTVEFTKYEEILDSNVSFYFRARYSCLYVGILKVFLEYWRPKAHTVEIFINQYMCEPSSYIPFRSRAVVESLPYNYSILWFPEVPATFALDDDYIVPYTVFVDPQRSRCP